MKELFLLAALLLGVLPAMAAPAKAKKADPDTLRLVKLFIEVPTGELPVEAIEQFLTVDSDTLPIKLKKPFQAKKLELMTLKHMADTQKGGNARTYSGDCAPPPGSKEADLSILRFGGFWSEITEEEEQFLLKRTDCTEQELLCEFSLQIALGKPPKKGGKRKRHYFLHPKDPLMAYVGEYRAGVELQPTRFFGSGGSITCRR